jgi:hypothetical protein
MSLVQAVYMNIYLMSDDENILLAFKLHYYRFQPDHDVPI